MQTVCKLNQCTGCAACISKCRKNAIHIEDNLKAYNAVIDETLCVNCGQCENVCPTNHSASFMQPIMWKQGWSEDESIRANASSGGLASALSVGFIKNGGAVCACVFKNGEFVFDFALSIDDIKKFAGSKYVKSNPIGIYQKINEYLINNRKVLFIGLPCQAASVKAYTQNHDMLYTVDLICHGTPSLKMLKMFLEEKGYKLENMKDVKFRNKANFHLSDGFKSIDSPSVRDMYTHAFLKSLCYTENCYSCKYARQERVSDITLGDSWGSQLSAEEQSKGISLILCQTAKGQELLSMASLCLKDVDIERAVANNKQLNKPSPKPAEYELFYRTLFKKKNFNKAVGKCYPTVCFRQRIKGALAKAGIIKAGGK